MTHALNRVANGASWIAGHHATSVLAILVVALWAAVGPLVGFSDTWLLLAGTVTSVVAFLMVFLIQHTQNRHSAAVHLKLNELLRAVEGANTALIRAEEEEDDELRELRRLYVGLCDERDALKALLGQQGRGGTPKG
jgi:low affinity Fe/Cu permease